jgi:hypothetical protein
MRMRNELKVVMAALIIVFAFGIVAAQSAQRSRVAIPAPVMLGDVPQMTFTSDMELFTSGIDDWYWWPKLTQPADNGVIVTVGLKPKPGSLPDLRMKMAKISMEHDDYDGARQYMNSFVGFIYTVEFDCKATQWRYAGTIVDVFESGPSKVVRGPARDEWQANDVVFAPIFKRVCR